MNALTLWQRLGVVFAALLLACFAAAAALQTMQSKRLAQEVEQHLLRRLAMHLAGDLATLSDPGAAAPEASDLPLKPVVDRLRITNPGVDLYVLDADGVILHRYPDTEPLRRPQVALGPLRDFLSGKPPPILGDDPLGERGTKVFSVATLEGAQAPAGFVYAVLQGSAYDVAAATAGRGDAWQVALWSAALVTPLGLLAGVFLFRWVTRPLTALTAEVQAMEPAGVAAGPRAGEPVRAPVPLRRDEIAILREAFHRLMQTNQLHWRSLAQQDQERREWLAHISHDLRTPLATMQGYLETVLLKPSLLSESERQHYLRTALSESQQLSRLAQALLDLARLELGTVKPTLESFSIVELAQDVMQKLALSASTRQKRLVSDFTLGLVQVRADIGMIERVLTNLLDNAIRHTPPGGDIQVALRMEGDRVRVVVADQGPGIAGVLRDELLAGVGRRTAGRDGGGLGLAVVQQILHLHGSSLQLLAVPGWATVLAFDLARES